MSNILRRLLVGREEKYPRVLEERFPRVFARVIELWGGPQLEGYLSDLVIDDKGDRQGFPPEAMSELLFLSRLHDEYLARKAEDKGDIWANEEIRRGIEQQNIEFSEQGFFKAIDTGNQEAVNLFIDGGIDLEVKNGVGWTPLMVSVFMGNEHAAEKLIQSGANVNAHDNRGYTPLHWAAYQGFARVVQFLLERGAAVNAKSEKGLTPLLQAAARGHAEVVRQLLGKRAAVSDADNEGWTPLHKAVANHHPEVVRLLMIAHADPYARHESGLTPIEIAKQKKFTDLLPILLRRQENLAE